MVILKGKGKIKQNIYVNTNEFMLAAENSFIVFFLRFVC
jgi:hypothetical protein